MAKEERSLWEIYDSEIPPWRRGRNILLCIALFNFALQLLFFGAVALSGTIDRLFLVAGLAVLFWLLFYFVWIGVHWLRWVWGGLNLLSGFCWLIYAWRDESALETIFAVTNFLGGAFLCSPSVYFFALRQKEKVRWKESAVVGAICLFTLGNIFAGSVGFRFLSEQRAADACRFANSAAEIIYHDRDRMWAVKHATQKSLANNGQERMSAFFQDSLVKLGSVHQIYFSLWKAGDDWEIDGMGWNFIPLAEKGAAVIAPD